jgi:L-cysteine:1D-myo-inositol 2-amino-2-deoxy-alpha-D-glucopyranoside ligase
LLRHHYRHGFEWFDTDLEDGSALLHRLLAAAERPTGRDPRPFADRVRQAIDNDLDTPRALDALDDLASAILSAGSNPQNDDEASAHDVLCELGQLLGIDLERPIGLGVAT